MENNYFNFENRDFDFPFYNKNPEISKFAWLVMLIAVAIGYVLYIDLNSFFDIFLLNDILFCVIPLIPILYYLNWDYKRLFRKPSLNDLGWAVAMMVAYFIFTVIFSNILPANFEFTNITMAAIDLTQEIPQFIILLMGEEIVKFFFFVLFLCILFKYTNNRKSSIIISMILSLLVFGFAHYIPSGAFLTAIVIQGLGSVFHLFLYVKTKNLVVSYTSHLLTDVIITVLQFLAML